MIADIPCYYELVGGVKVLHLADNPNLKNYFDQFSGSNLSNKRSEGFFNYFFTQASTEPYIKVEKSLLDFTGGAYSQPYYLVYNCDYFMETSHYIDVTVIDLSDQGIYVPLKDDKSYCIFYVNTNEPISDEISLIDTYIKVEKNIDVGNILKFSVDEGIFDEDFNFIPLTESTIYNLNDIFYMGEYVTIAGGVTINNKGPIPCLTKDTMILTPIGYINIQKLRKSDYVITDDLRKVKIKNILVTYSKGSIQNSPYIIHKNSIGKNYPPCTFKVSPSHLIKYKDKWIHPRDSKMFKQDLSESIIKYYHIELENYETDNLVINDGAIVESFGGYSKYANIYKERKYNIKKNNIK
jgi:hypothetical protein